MIEMKLENQEELKKLFDPVIVKKAIDSSLGKTAAKTRTFISRAVRKDWNVKAKDISQTVSIFRTPQGRAIYYKGERISLLKFSPTIKNIKTKMGKRTGLTVRVKKKSGRKLVKHGFVGFGRSGNFMAFKRQGSDRLPIRRLTGPAIAQMVGTQEKEVIDFVTKEQDGQFETAMNYFLLKATGSI